MGIEDFLPSAGELQRRRAEEAQRLVSRAQEVEDQKRLREEVVGLVAQLPELIRATCRAPDRFYGRPSDRGGGFPVLGRKAEAIPPGWELRYGRWATLAYTVLWVTSTGQFLEVTSLVKRPAFQWQTVTRAEVTEVKTQTARVVADGFFSLHPSRVYSRESGHIYVRGYDNYGSSVSYMPERDLANLIAELM